MWWWLPRRRWTRILAAAIATPIFAAAGVAGYYYGQFSRLVEARLQGERVRTIPRVFGRPLTLRAGLTLGSDDVVQRLNDLGYTARSVSGRPNTRGIVRTRSPCSRASTSRENWP
jgi:hypothetical protein